MFVLSKMQNWTNARPDDRSGAFAAFQKYGSGFTVNVWLCLWPSQTSALEPLSEFQLVL